jgi:hypothetical protein
MDYGFAYGRSVMIYSKTICPYGRTKTAISRLEAASLEARESQGLLAHSQGEIEMQTNQA